MGLPLTEEIKAAERGRLSGLLDALVPPDASSLSRDGGEALLWRLRQARIEGRPGDVVGLFRAGSGMTRPVRAGNLPSYDAAFVAVLSGGAKDVSLWEVGIHLHDPVPGRIPDAPGRRALVDRLVEGMDAVGAMLSHDVGSGFVDGESPAPCVDADGERYHAMMATHPWLWAFHSRQVMEVVRASPEASPDGLARAVLHALSPEDQDRHGRLVRTLGRLPQLSHPMALCELPPDLSWVPDRLLPKPLPRVGPYRPCDLGEVKAFYLVAPMAAAMASNDGRAPVSVLGRLRTWDSHLARLGVRAGVPRREGPWRERLAFDVGERVTEMAQAFATEVVAPAAMAAYGPSPPGTGAYTPVTRILRPFEEEPLMAAAYRVLFGRRTLPAVAEMSARWHRRVSAISEAVAEIDAALPGLGMGGPRLFEDLDTGDGTYMTCLCSSRDLIEEGNAGPDGRGVPGLDHCVGSYLQRVRKGRVAVVSVRRRVAGGYVRLSTAEIDFVHARAPAGIGIRQHRGLRNGAAPAEAVRALGKGLPLVASRARAALAALRASAPADRGVAEAIHEAGAWERMRDLWSFALTRPQRAMGPAELLRDAGFAQGTVRPADAA